MIVLEAPIPYSHNAYEIGTYLNNVDMCTWEIVSVLHCDNVIDENGRLL